MNIIGPDWGLGPGFVTVTQGRAVQRVVPTRPIELRDEDRTRLREWLPDDAIAELLDVCGALATRIKSLEKRSGPAKRLEQLAALRVACASMADAIEKLDEDLYLGTLGNALGPRAAALLVSRQLPAIMGETERAIAAGGPEVRRGQTAKVELRKALPLAIEHLVSKHGVRFSRTKDTPFHVICSVCFTSCGLHSPDRTLRAIFDARERAAKPSRQTQMASSRLKKSIPSK